MCKTMFEIQKNIIGEVINNFIKSIDFNSIQVK